MASDKVPSISILGKHVRTWIGVCKNLTTVEKIPLDIPGAHVSFFLAFYGFYEWKKFQKGALVRL